MSDSRQAPQKQPGRSLRPALHRSPRLIRTTNPLPHRPGIFQPRHHAPGIPRPGPTARGPGNPWFILPRRNPSDQLPRLAPPFDPQLPRRDLVPPPHHRRRRRPVPLQRRGHGPEPRCVLRGELAHGPVIGRDARALRAVQHGRRAALVDDVVPRVLQVGPVLLPEEEDAEAREERGELVVDVLEHFGVFFQGPQEGGVRLEGLFGEGGGGELLEAAEEVRFAGAEVRGAEEEDGVGAGVDGVEVGDFGGGAGFGVCQGSFDDDAA